MAGKMNFLYHGVLLKACLVARWLQKFTSDLRVDHLRQAHAVLKYIQQLNPIVTYIYPDVSPSTSECILQTFADASKANHTYGQNGLISGLLLPTGGGAKSIFHPLTWHSSKQTRISFSYIGAEIMSAGEASDTELHLRICLKTILHNPASFPVSLKIDSYGLYSTIITLHEGLDYLLRPTVAPIRPRLLRSQIIISSSMDYSKGQRCRCIN